MSPDGNSQSRTRGALFVALGIFLSRILGLVRERVFAHYLGNSLAADAYKGAVRIPNLLQNLLGEGVLSASFIPVYSGMLARGSHEQAKELAWRVLRTLTALVTVVSAIGVLLSPLLVDLIAPGFEGEKRELTITLTRILFPGSGVLVLSAWCLGVSNSHHRFFLPYVAPVVWNIVLISTLIFFGASSDGPQLVQIVAWGAIVASLAQLLIQTPQVFALLSSLKGNGGGDEEPETVDAAFNKVVKNLIPVTFGRGVVQISAYVDSMIASLLGGGAVAALSYAQTIYLLPISLFGMSVSAAELPAMSRIVGGRDEDSERLLAERLRAGSRQIAFFIVPSMVAFIVLGPALVGAVFQTGEFRKDDTLLVCSLLSAMALGLLPGTLGRLYSSTYYALHDTKTPVRFAIIRVGLSVSLAFLFAIFIPRYLGLPEKSGLRGIGYASAIGALVEFLLLRRGLQRKLPRTENLTGYIVRLFVCAGLAAAASVGASLLVVDHVSPHPIVEGFSAACTFGIVYFGAAAALGVPEFQKLFRRVRRA